MQKITEQLKKRCRRVGQARHLRYLAQQSRLPCSLGYTFKNALSLCCMLAIAATLHAEKVDVYLLGGQSNMDGQGSIRELTDKQKVIPQKVYFWHDNQFKPFVVGAFPTSVTKQPDRFGLEVSFAQKIAGERPVYLVKFARGGMPLHHGWHAGKWIGGEPAPRRANFYPGESAGDPNIGRLYAGMIERFRAAIEQLKADGHTPVVNGFLWMQGEQDSKHEVSATEYAQNLKRLRGRIMDDLKLDQLTMAFGEVCPEPLERFPHRDEIRSDLQSADMNSGSSKAIEQSHLVRIDNCELKRDKVHHNTAGYYQLGLNFAKVFEVLNRNNSGN